MKYALLENGVIHTDDLTMEDAKEMLDRHISCFPDCRWEIVKAEDTKGRERGRSLLERQKAAYRAKG